MTTSQDKRGILKWSTGRTPQLYLHGAPTSLVVFAGDSVPRAGCPPGPPAASGCPPGPPAASCFPPEASAASCNLGGDYAGL